MNKTAIVTGGGRGIGFAVCRRLGMDGYNVVIVGTSPAERYRQNLAKLDSDGIEHLYIQGDICDARDRTRILDEVVEKYGQVRVLVNNCGVAPVKRNDLLEMSEESFDRVIGVNTKGTMFFTQLVAKQMITQPLEGGKRGTIVNVSSLSAEVSSVNRGEYCISKAGVSMLTTLYADRLAREGIVVNEVRPGVIATDMTVPAKEKYDKMIAEGAFPIARWGLPEDVAAAVSAFCSDDFSYITGNYINVDGGYHIKRL